MPKGKNVIYLDESVLNAFTYIQFKVSQFKV